MTTDQAFSQPLFRNHGRDRVPQTPEADAFLAGPAAWDEASRDAWLQTVERLFGPERDCNASSGFG